MNTFALLNSSRIKTRAAMQHLATRPRTWAIRLLPVLTLSALCVVPVMAQKSPDARSPLFNPTPTHEASENAQLDNYGGGVFTDTLLHQPQHPVAFTDSPRRAANPESRETIDELKRSIRPEGIEDDYDNNNPTAWVFYTGQSATQVSALISQGYRIIDLVVDTASPLSFSVTMVANTGAYAKGWWWYYGETTAQISSQLATNNARLISVKGYDAGGGNIRYAAVMISNTGADAKGWWWYVGQSVSGISSLLTTNHARLIAVDAYKSGTSTLYTAIMIPNAGADSDSWWWYVNATPASLASNISANNARITYITPGSTSGTFNAIMEGCTSVGCSEWWYYYGQTASQLLNLAVQNGARLVDFQRYAGCGSYCYVGAMINNSNAITTRVGNMLRAGNIGGTKGLYLKQVGGNVLANLEDNVVYEPASSIKVVANLYAMTQVQAAAITLPTAITHYANGADSCPNPPAISGTETLALALREMMFHSDNARTREITDHFTDSTINTYAHNIGMTSTGINHYIGCGGPTPDTLTLDDAALLYEGVANQSLINARSRGIFYSNMAGRAQFESEGYDWTGLWSTDIPNIINQVAPAGYTAAQKTAYQGAMNLVYKAGNYVLCTNNNCSAVNEDIAISGWFQLPFCSASGTTYNEYVFGLYFSNSPYSNWTSGTVTPTDNNFTTAKGELLREQIQAGMASCSGKSLQVMTYSPADLVFATTKVGVLTAAKTVTVTNKQLTTVSGLAIAAFGDFGVTNNCGSSLGAGKSCTITVKFKPTVTGERTGAVILSDAASGQPQTIQLTGTGN